MRKAMLLILSTLLAGTACEKAPVSPQAGQGGFSTVAGIARKPAEGATVYLYRPGMDLRGPPFTKIGPLGPDGSFSADLPAGNYLFILRQRGGTEETGPVREGDLKSDPVPVTVEAGKPVSIDLNAYVKTGNAKEAFGEAVKWPTSFSGTITDTSGNPVEGVRVHVYDHVQMSERPRYVSPRTGPDGKFTISLPEGGTFYLCARDKYGGPPKVGDLYGRYDKGTVEPSALIISEGQNLERVDMVVHTVW